MNIYMVIIIGIALAMDALGVSLSIGVNSSVNREKKIQYIISFGFFQFLFILIGGTLGYYFDSYIVEIPNVLGGIVIGIVGILMLIDGKKESNNSVLVEDKMLIVLGVSVSIDALVVGFSALHQFGSAIILFLDSIIVGLITAFLCFIAFFLCRYFRKIYFVNKYADYLGGIVLIIFAIKMIFL